MKQKNRFSGILILLSCLMLFSCSSEKIQKPENKIGSFELLFSVKEREQKENAGIVFPLENGFFLVSETDNGSKITYIDIENKVTVDGLINSEEKDISSYRAWINENSDPVITSNSEFYTVNPEKKVSDKRTFPENFGKNYLVYDASAFISTDEDASLVILTPFDFSEKYVLAEKSELRKSTYPLSSYGKNLFFAEKTEWGFENITLLKYGEKTAELISDTVFGDYRILSSGNILTKCENVYSFVDAKSGKITEYTFSRKFDGFSASDDFSVFAGTYTESGTDYIEIINTLSGESKITPIGNYKVSDRIAVSGNGKYVLFVLENPNPDSKEETVAYISVD